MKIGFVVNVLEEAYQNSILSGIKARAKELNIDVICIQQDEHINVENSLLGNYHTESYCGLDGIILLNSVMADSFSFKTKSDVEEIWGNLPVICLGQQIENVPSILVQTDYSMKQLVEHLISVHNYTDFVFLAGPEKHHDAIQRKEIFLKTMEAYKPWYSNLKYTVKTGSFSESSALRMMNELYEENADLNPDVVVCSTDNMAIGVYKFFKMHRNDPKIKECAVTGFDDIPQSRYEIPSITTVRQPLEEMGIEAVNSLCRLIKGEDVKQLAFIESSVIIRESCGCNHNNSTSKYQKQLLSDLQSEYIFSEQMLRALTHFEQDLNYSNSRNLLRYFIDQNIASLDIKDFSILIMSNENNQNYFEPFYVRRNGVSVDPFNDYKKMFFNEFLEKYFALEGSNKNLVIKYLISNNQVYGLVMYDCKNSMNPYICSMAVSISQTIVRIFNQEEKQRYSNYLEEEVTKRTSELLEANNKRMEVEAEVLRISELERQRFSNDLHDDICQRLAGISMLCRSYSNQTKPIENKQMIELAELISDTLTTTRQYAHNSYPVELESLGLNYAISNLCNSFEKQTDMKTEYIWNADSVNFDSTQKLNIFRIIQEALHNILKHSKAKNVCVSLENKGDIVIIKVSDDGCGIPVYKDGKNQGLGINSMKYRANQIGADFEIKANEPKGTCVVVSIKIESENV